MKTYSDIFQQIVLTENLFLSWDEFKKDKQKKKDVLAFEWELEKRILELYRDLKYHTYRHDVYTAFMISDPKQRNIHKAIVRDRIVHHAIYRVLYPIFDKRFISDSYSCRLGKGTHKAVKRLESFVRKVSRNYTKPCFALKCDIKKFFDTIDHHVLITLLERNIIDEKVLSLLKVIVGSFNHSAKNQLPLFNIAICETQIERERERDDSLRLSMAKVFPSAI